VSQVKFKTPFIGKRIEIMAGWDRPLQHYFLTIFNLDEDEDEVYWSTLDFPSDEDNHGTERLRRQLDSMGIPAPEGFWERVERQEGNVNHDFKDGAWESY
jgi:hypothetical protein